MEEEKKTQEFVCDENPVIEDSVAAKRIKALGEDAVNVHESKFGGKRIGKIENFWYQHRWHAGLTIAFVVIAIVAVVQLITRVTPDINIVYTGPGSMLGSGYERFEAALTELMDDYNGDGKKEISMADNTYFSAEQIKEKQKLGQIVDVTANQSSYERYMVEITSREYLLCMLDPSLFREVKDNSGFLSLKEIFGDDIPSSAFEDYGIRLGDTDFYKEHKSEFFFIPADTILSVMTLPEDASEKKKEMQKYHIELLRAIANYTTPDEEATP